MSLSKAEATQAAVLKKYAEAGVTTTKLSDDILKALKKASLEVMQEEAAKDPLFKKVWESQKAFEASYAKWRDLGYLPASSR